MPRLGKADHVREVERQIRGALAQAEQSGVSQVHNSHGVELPNVPGDVGTDAIGCIQAGHGSVQRPTELGGGGDQIGRLLV